MNRRKFLGLTIGGVAASAAVRTWPFRVYSFPKEPTLGVMLPIVKEDYYYVFNHLLYPIPLYVMPCGVGKTESLVRKARELGAKVECRKLVLP